MIECRDWSIRNVARGSSCELARTRHFAAINAFVAWTTTTDSSTMWNYGTIRWVTLVHGIVRQNWIQVYVNPNNMPTWRIEMEINDTWIVLKQNIVQSRNRGWNGKCRTIKARFYKRNFEKLPWSWLSVEKLLRILLFQDRRIVQLCTLAVV